jgi:hypothetical protein
MAGPKVALHPAGSPVARRQFAWTVEREVDFRPFAAALGRNLAPLLKAFPHGDARIWGVSAGPGARAVGEFGRLTEGDVVLFVRDAKVFAAGRVAHRWSSATLARRLWGAPPAGQSWIGMYALDRFGGLDVPVAEMNAAAGYKPGYASPGFRVLDAVRSAAVLAHLGDELDGVLRRKARTGRRG